VGEEKAQYSGRGVVDSAGYFRILRPILWMALFLALVEVALEYRAHRRGWDTAIFGAVRSEHARPEPGAGQPKLGPTPDFPFRGPVVKGQKPADTVRIWVAGASHGEDIYLPADVVFPNVIGAKLRLYGVSAEVLNASRAGTAIDGDLAFLKREFERWRPDVVVLYQLSLDLALLSRQFLGPVRGKAAESEPVDGSRTETTRDASWAGRLYGKTTSYELLNAVVTTRISALQPSNDDIGTEARAAFRRRLTRFVDEVRALGAEPVLCTFSTSFSPTSTAPVPVDVELFAHRFANHLSARGWLAAVEQLNKVIRDVAEDRRTPLVDTATVLAGREEMFRDQVHFTTEGHGVLADTIAIGLLRTTAGLKRTRQ
jgi:hypothetical protein